jgi:hypothetical protein
MNGKKLIFNGGIIVSFLTLLLIQGCATAKNKPAAVVVPEKEAMPEKKVAPEEVATAKEEKAVKKYIAIKQPSKKIVMDDVLFYHDLQEIDLNEDEKPEIVAIYTNNLNLGAVKVLKIKDDKIEGVIFQETFNSPEIKFQVKEGMPIIIVKEKSYPFGFKTSKVYQWNGRAFICEKDR